MANPSPYAHPDSAAAGAHDFAHYVGQLIHWGAAEWRHVFHGGPDPGPPPLPGGANTPPAPPPGPPNPPPSSGTMYWALDSSAAHLVSPAQLAAFVAAENTDLPRLRAQWPNVKEWTHVVATSRSSPPLRAVVSTLVAELPEAPGALAYHDVTPTGVPYQRVGVKTCLDNGVSWQSAADHETKELTVDPLCTVVVTDPVTGWTYAFEIADPVEGDSYQVDGQDMSNSVGPAWFGEPLDGGTPGFDLLGKVSAAFTMDPGGYVIVDKHDGRGPQPVFGERFPAFRREHVLALGRKGTARRPRRVAASP